MESSTRAAAGMRVLVTGGAGYIGSHAARALQCRGHQAVVYDNLSTGHEALARGFELVVGDIGDVEKLKPALQRVDAVMHFAAHTYVGESVADPRKYFQNNVGAALTLLNTAVDAGIRRFIFSSSCAVYGLPQRIPITEDQPRVPCSPYGTTKLAFEHALEAYGTAYGMCSARLRYFNAAGADESGEIGELHEPETHLIPSILQAVQGLRPELEIYGSDYPTPDGTCIRDYIHVSDLADAHVAALEYLQAGGESLALNLGTGRGHSILEVIEAVERNLLVQVPRRSRPRRPGDPASLVADASKAASVLRWRATRSLAEIITSAWNWMKRANLSRA